MNSKTFDHKCFAFAFDAGARALSGLLLLGGILASGCVSAADSGENNINSARSASSAPENSFTGLGTLPGRGNGSEATAVSGDGTVVVGYSGPATMDGVKRPAKVFGMKIDAGGKAFRWTAAGGMVNLGTLPGGDSSFANSVSSDGAVVVGWNYTMSGNQFQAFRWTTAGGMVGLGTLPDTRNSYASGVSNDGSIVVGTSFQRAFLSEHGQAFRWTVSGGMVRLSALPDWCTHSKAAAISGDGSVVVGDCLARPTGVASRAFRWTTADGMVLLDALPKRFPSFVTGASRNGTVVVGVNTTRMGLSVSQNHLFRWTVADGMQDLSFPHNWRRNSLCARAVSGDGSVIVADSPSPENWNMTGEGFIWDSTNGARNLQSVLIADYHMDLTGWKLIAATGISADGKTLIGNGKHDGCWEGWVAHLNKPVNALALKRPSK